MILLTGQSVFRAVSILLICLLLGGGLFGLGYWQGERVTRQKMQASVAKVSDFGPRREASRIGSELAGPLTRSSVLPVNASPEMQEYLKNRATLLQKMTELRQAGKSSPGQDLMRQFQQQNAALLQRQKELAQIIAQQQAKNPLPTPPPLRVPPNASPQLKAFLTARDQLVRDQIAFINQHRTDDAPTRQAAMQQWRQENASRIQEVQQLAQAISQATSSGNPN